MISFKLLNFGLLFQNGFCSISNGIGGGRNAYSKQLIQDLDYSIPLIPHSHLKLSCLQSGVRVGSHDPFFRNHYFSGIVSAHIILIRMTNFFEF